MAYFPPLTSNPNASADPSARQYEMGPWYESATSFTTSSSPPTLGNGTCLVRFRRQGSTIYYQQQLTIGSTTTVGTGIVRLHLPFGMTYGSMQQVGSAFWFDASTGIITRGVCIAEGATTYAYSVLGDGVTPSDSSGLANGDLIRHSGTFEIDTV